MDNTSASIKHWLWKKESHHPDALFVDYFSALLKDQFRTFVVDRLLAALNEQVQKSDDVSKRLQKLGAREFCKRNWKEATELYNIGVCTAENGSSDLRLAYKARSNCFTNRGMNEEANIDIDLSAEPPTQVSKRSSNRIQTRRISNVTCELKRMFVPNEKFPNLTNALEVRHNSVYGRHIVSVAALFIYHYECDNVQCTLNNIEIQTISF